MRGGPASFGNTEQSQAPIEKCGQIEPIETHGAFSALPAPRACNECGRPRTDKQKQRACPTCASRKHRANNPEYYRLKAKRHRADPIQGHKLRVRRVLRHAVSKGKVHPLPCEVCGNPQVDGHHDDYSKPLDVRWLCRKHHSELHKQLARQT